jgi:hypothetical protein
MRTRRLIVLLGLLVAVLAPSASAYQRDHWYRRHRTRTTIVRPNYDFTYTVVPRRTWASPSLRARWRRRHRGYYYNWRERGVTIVTPYSVRRPYLYPY